MLLKISVAEVERRVKDRKKGYLEAVKRAARRDGEHFWIEESKMQKIVSKHTHKELGDYVYWAIHPFVLLLDNVFEMKLEQCKKCAGRRRYLNQKHHQIVLAVKLLVNNIARNTALFWKAEVRMI